MPAKRVAPKVEVDAAVAVREMRDDYRYGVYLDTSVLVSMWVQDAHSEYIDHWCAAAR